MARAAGVLDLPGMQDWPLEAADPERILEFLDLYEASEDRDDRFAVMELILYSLERCDGAERDRYWRQIEMALERDPMEHAHNIIYWSCVQEVADGVWELDGPDEEGLPLTSRMRPVLVRVRDSIGFLELRVQPRDLRVI